MRSLILKLIYAEAKRLVAECETLTCPPPSQSIQMRLDIARKRSSLPSALLLQQPTFSPLSPTDTYITSNPNTQHGHACSSPPNGVAVSIPMDMTRAHSLQSSSQPIHLRQLESPTDGHPLVQPQGQDISARALSLPLGREMLAEHSRTSLMGGRRTFLDVETGGTSVSRKSSA